ncbi:SDR family oxidoreductase [Leucobacter sp. NPDC015123]|uniref:SDR family oxidoreductase n=1 Tax=Leucobacter sp. NPDC015123 TaxID=3364129 RepID=UPI0036F49122
MNESSPTVVGMIGGHGQIALRTTRLLSAVGHRVLSVIRNPDHAADVELAGGEPVMLDLERTNGDELARALGAAGTLVFAAGAGPGSGPERKETVDHQGALTTMTAAAQLGARVVQISYIGVATAPPESMGVDFAAYQRAKYAADLALEASGLDWVIVRPGTLTNDAGAGRVTVGARLDRGPVSRDNVARVLAEIVARPKLRGLTVDILDGDTEIERAVANLGS